MSAELLARKAVAELRRIQAEKVAGLRKCRPRAPTVLPDGAGTIPSATCEEVAMYAIDINATVDALNVAIETIELEFKRLSQPEEPAPDTEQPQARKFHGY